MAKKRVSAKEQERYTKHTASVEGGVSRRKAGLGFYQSV